MKRTLAIVAVLGLGSAISGCNSQDKPVTQAQSHNALTWKLTLQSKCVQGAEDACVAGHGFAVAEDGSYVVGPAPGGKVVKGSLSPEELKALKEKIANLSVQPSSESASSSEAESCQGLNADNTSELSVLLNDKGKESVVASTKDSQLCFQPTNAEAAAELSDIIYQLAQKYYTLPFPDACSDAVSALESLYSTIQGCKQDSDCVYVTADYKIIPASSDEFVMTNAGTRAKPLVVANSVLLEAQRSSLASATSDAQNACGSGTAQDRYNVGSGIDGFLANVKAPSCQQGVCRAPAPASEPAPEAPAAPAEPAAPAPAPAPAPGQ